MNIILAALFFLQAMQAGPLVDNEFVQVFKNSAPCATAANSCGERVVVALAPIELNGQKMERGDVKVLKPGERYTSPKAGNFLEVSIKPTHPKVMPPAAGTPAAPGNKILYDGKEETRELVPDVVMWRPAVVHASKDVGSVPISNLLIEFKP